MIENTDATCKGLNVDLRSRVLDLRKTLEQGYLEMAELLSRVQNERLYLHWNFQTFGEYCEKELGFREAKAQQLVRIWLRVHALNLEPKRVQGIGWTKVREILPYMTKENRNELIAKAENLSLRGLEKEMRKLRSSDTSEKLPTLRISTDVYGHRIVLDALAVAQDLLGGNVSIGRALMLICEEWFMRQDAMPELTRLDDHLRYIEDVYHKKFVPEPINPSEGQEQGSSKDSDPG